MFRSGHETEDSTSIHNLHENIDDTIKNYYSCDCFKLKMSTSSERQYVSDAVFDFSFNINVIDIFDTFAIEIA